MKKIPISEIDSIFKAVNEREKPIDIKKREDSIKVTSGSKTLEISKDGKVKGAMPLHNFETTAAESIEVEKNKIKVNFENGSYNFSI